MMVEPLDDGEMTMELDVLPNQENLINKNGEKNENFTKTKMFEEFFQWPGDVTIIGNNNKKKLICLLIHPKSKIFWKNIQGAFYFFF